MRRFTEEEKEQIWDWHRAGVPVKRIARRLGRNNASLRKLVGETGGVRPRARVVNERHLSLEEREEISRGLAAGLSVRAIAFELGRSPSTVCREVQANGGRSRYRALVAEHGASPTGPATQSGQVGGKPTAPGQSGRQS
jgi:transposase, IS30 family